MAPKPFTPARVAKLVQDPGSRSTVPTRLLPVKYRKQRELNARLDAPVTPGSSLTQRELAHQVKSAIEQRYGQRDLAEQQALATQQAQNATAQNWYASYLKQLQQHAANAAAYQQQVAQNVTAFTGMNSEQAANGQLAPRLNSWANQSATIGAANLGRANDLANVIGPAAALQAGMQGQAKVTQLQQQQRQTASEKGAYGQNIRSSAVANEQKIVTAGQLAGDKNAIAKFNADTARIRATRPSGKAPPVPWYTWKQWNGLSSEQKRGAVKDYKAGNGGSKPKGKSPYSAPSVQSGAWQKIESTAQVLRGGTVDADHGDIKKGTPLKSLTYAQIRSLPKTPVSGALLRAAYEIAKYGRLSGTTARMLHNEGLQIKGRYQIAQPTSVNLGVGGKATGSR